MSQQTQSESIFEDFCSLHSIPCEKIPEKQDTRTPDYDIKLPSTDAVVEVKGIKNAKEKHSRLITKRIRSKIRDAREQLHRCGSPTVIVLSSNKGDLLTYGGAISYALYGQVTEYPSRVKKSYITAKQNLEISAVAFIRKDLSIEVFRNPAALHPLDSESMEALQGY